MEGNTLTFTSRRPVILSTHGAVACADPRAAQIGLDTLKAGGNAADAAIATAAALNVTLPMFTGVGGDAFCLYYDASKKVVRGLNGSGRSAAGMSLDRLHTAGVSAACPWSTTDGLTVTVPGAPALWVDVVQTLGSGKLTLGEVLQPAIGLAETGHGVGQIASYYWNKGSGLLTDPRNVHAGSLLIDGRPPRWGQVFRNHDLARTFKTLAVEGKRGFYEGRLAEAIVEAVARYGGLLTLEDLATHEGRAEDPISTDYRGVRLWEIPPHGQGIVALMALNILRQYDIKAMGHNSPAYLHHLVEAVRLSFADALQYVADPAEVEVPVCGMLDQDYSVRRSGLINPNRARESMRCGTPPLGGDTVYLTTADKAGNACSFIMSNFMGFGTGIVPKGCGFTLQNRGYNFSLEPGHPNVAGPRKRPYHTIIPAMLTDSNTGDLLASYGIMGAFMQPQGHLQLLLNMLEFGMNPQEALDKPRFCVGSGHGGAVGAVHVEEGIPLSTVEELRAMGHDVVGPVSGHQRALFGRGHVITRGAWWAGEELDVVDDRAVLWSGTDSRADGLAVGY